MRTCKTCKKEKQHIYLCLNSRGRLVYKDETGRIWQGRMCGLCFNDYVKRTSGKEPLGDKACEKCGTTFKKKAHRQRFCSADCSNHSKLPLVSS